jgi:hypothetical protein
MTPAMTASRQGLKPLCQQALPRVRIFLLVFFCWRGGTSVEHIYAIAAIWLALAVLATMLASHLRMPMALVEICVGMTHNIVTKEQYSFLVAAVIGSAVIPTMIANAFFLPRHLLPDSPMADEEMPQLEAALAGADDSMNGLGDE